MLADKNMVANLESSKSNPILHETNKNSQLEAKLTNNSSILGNNNNNNTNNTNTSKNQNNNNIITLTKQPLPTTKTTNTATTASTTSIHDEIAITNDSNEADILIKIERNSPSPAPSLLLNNLSDFSCDFDEDDEESGSEEFDGSTPSEFNYDIKLSSPVSWAFQPIKIENIEEDSDNIPIVNQPIQLSSVVQTQDQNSQTIISSAVTNGGLASAVAAIANQSIASIKKSTTTLVPIKQNSHHQNKINTSEQLLKIFSSAALQSTNNKSDIPILGGGTTTSTLVTLLPAITTSTTKITQDNVTNAIIPKGTSIRLVHKLESTTPSFTSKTLNNNNISPLPTTITTAASSLNNNTNVVSTTCNTINPTTITGPDDKKYRILYQNQRIRKESLEHSSDMIYKGFEVEKPWICKNCNRDYKWKNSLKCHLKNECGQPPRYFCKKMCGYRTNVHSNLKRHMNTKCKDDDKESCSLSNEQPQPSQKLNADNKESITNAA